MLTSSRWQSFHASCSEYAGQICNQLWTRVQIGEEGLKEFAATYHDSIMIVCEVCQHYMFCVSKTFGGGCYATHNE